MQDFAPLFIYQVSMLVSENDVELQTKGLFMHMQTVQKSIYKTETAKKIYVYLYAAIIKVCFNEMYL